MTDMDKIVQYVRSFGGIPVPGSDIVNDGVTLLGIDLKKIPGAVGNAIRYGKLQVVGEIEISGKTVNLFE